MRPGLPSLSVPDFAALPSASLSLTGMQSAFPTLVAESLSADVLPALVTRPVGSAESSRGDENEEFDRKQSERERISGYD